MSKQSKTSFNKMTVFTLSDAVLLGGMWAGHTVRYTSALKILMKLMIFTTPVRLDGFNFGVEKKLDMSLESIKHLLDIRFVFKKINPAKTRVVINETNIVLKTTRRSNCRTPNIRVNELKRCSGNTMRQTI
jgi:hypothetical protein